MRYQLRVTQNIKAWMEGYINIEADSKEDALVVFKAMGEKAKIDWEPGVQDIEDLGEVEALLEEVQQVFNIKANG